MIVPFGERAYYARASDDRDSRARDPARTARSISTASSACIRALAPLEPLFDARQLAIVHACGSPDDDAVALRRAGLHGERHARREEHARRLAEPLPARAASTQDATPFRAVALAPQLPRSLQGTAPALAIGQLGQFGIRAGHGDRHDADVVRVGVRRGGADRAAPTGREAFDAVKMLKNADPARYTPGNGAEYPRSPLRRRAAADRAAHQGRRRARGGVRRVGQLGSPRQRRRGDRPARQPTRRLRARHRRVRPRPRRSHGRRRGRHDVGVRPHRARRTATAAPTTATATRC